MTLHPADVYPPGGGATPYQLLDVRAPVEVGRGALPGALGLPLLMDEERHLVGLRYQAAGQEAAIALGFELLAGTLSGRVEAWRAAVEAAGQDTAVSCWRGGLRSSMVVDFIGSRRATRVEGGYKAIRAHLLGSLPGRLAGKRMVVLTGLTGAGKTRLLNRLKGVAGAPQALDLEGLARHRGSAFGHHAEPQPSQQTFENAVAAELVLDPAPRIVVEDESRFVGQRTLPEPLLAAMQVAPVVVLAADKASRALTIHGEYVRERTSLLGVAAVAEDLRASIRRLRRRLGGGVADDLDARVARLAQSEEAWADAGAHAEWIGALLEHHYDPLYKRALGKLTRPLLYAGDEEAVAGWLTTGW